LTTGVKSFPAPNGDIKAFVDDWGEPLLFSRWPSGSADLDKPGVAPSDKAGSRRRDPLDPDGTLLAVNWNNPVSNNPAQFEKYLHPVTKGGKPYAYYLVPVLVSGGRDNRLDVDTTLAITGGGAADNVYSYNIERE